MKRLLAAGVVGVLFLAAPLPADPPPYLEFVQGLRNQGHPDLALQYIEEHLTKVAPPDLRKELPVEIAKTLAEMAQREGVAAKRDALYARARKELEAFLKANAQSPRAADANLELARLLALEGKTYLSRSEHAQQAEARKADLAKARGLFEDARKRFQDAAAFIDARLKANPSDKDKRALTQTRARAELEEAVNLLNVFLAYDPEEAGKERLTASNKAREALQKLAGGDDKNPLTWLGRAWLGRYYYETEDFRTAKTTLQKVIDDKTPASADGRRVAKYVYLLVLNRDAENKNALADKVKVAEQWLKDYPNFIATPEGFGVRFQLAEALYEQALKSSVANQTKLFGQAEKIFDELERTRNDFTEQARERKMEIVYTRSAGRSKGDITKLNNFEECYLRAQVEIGQMNKEGKDQAKGKGDPKLKPEDRAKRRQKHIADMTQALNRALDLAGAQTPPKDLQEVRYLLTFLYLTEWKDPYRAAILGEELVCTAPTSDRAAVAAAYALEAYFQVMNADQGKEDADPRDVEADQRRLRRLAAYMEKALPTDPATDRARQLLASFSLKENDLPEAIRVLSQITPAYPGYTFTQYQLAVASLQYQEELDKQARDDGKPLDEKNRLHRQKALEALKSIPDLDSGADAVTTQFYFYGKLDLAKLLFGLGQYGDMAKLVESVQARYQGTKDKPGAKAKLDEATRKKIDATLAVLPVYVDYGKADAAYEKGDYAEVRKLLAPWVKELMDSKLQGNLEAKFARTLLVMDLRASIQENEVDKAGDVLKLLLQNKSAQNIQATAVILEELGRKFENQLEELRKKGSSARAELDRKAKNFAAFHKLAADELAKFPPPEAPAGKQADPKDLAFYRYVQILCIREMRLGKQFEPARTKLKKEMTTPWGKNSMELKKELYCLWEDEGNYLAAAKAWSDLLSTLQRMEKTERLRDLYYESYYHLVYSAFKAGQQAKDPTKQESYIRTAASLLTKLQQSKPLHAETTLQMLDELRKKEPMLDAACKKLE